MSKFAPNPDLSIKLTRIGTAREPVLIIDDFSSDPHALVAAACAAEDWHDLAPGGYPGRRCALPGSYVRATLRRLDAPIRAKLFGAPMRLDRFDCSFSLVTRAPSDLTHLQRVPHIDIARASRVAVLHYLCDASFGGTAFFRQDDTGLEQIDAGDKARYLASRAAGLAELRPEDDFPNENTPGYTRTGFTQARFNRLVAYRSFTLHSGIIENPDLLSEDPAKGRLTTNFFVDYAPVS